tara:strand:+ start:9105 stop:9347 length:243 start_codon:yes stop_codon:yes gene_type:complete
MFFLYIFDSAEIGVYTPQLRYGYLCPISRVKIPNASQLAAVEIFTFVSKILCSLPTHNITPSTLWGYLTAFKKLFENIFI